MLWISPPPPPPLSSQCITYDMFKVEVLTSNLQTDSVCLTDHLQLCTWYLLTLSLCRPTQVDPFSRLKLAAIDSSVQGNLKMDGWTVDRYKFSSETLLLLFFSVFIVLFGEKSGCIDASKRSSWRPRGRRRSVCVRRRGL